MEFNIFSFPWEQIGGCLRELSLSGAVGNVSAIIIYFIIGSIPIVIFFVLKKKHMICKIDGMLFLLCPLLLAMEYYMINPGLLPSTMLGSGRILLGGAFYSVLIGYLVLRIILKNGEKNLQGLQKSLRTVLYVVMILFVWAVVEELVISLPTALQKVQEANATSDSFFYEAPDLTMTNMFLICHSIIVALSNALCAVAIFLGIKTIDELLTDSYSERAVLQIRKIVVFCKKTLVFVIASEMVFNLAQVFFISKLHYMNISVNIPVFAILLILAIHVFARYIEENQKLKEDNSLFI